MEIKGCVAIEGNVNKNAGSVPKQSGSASLADHARPIDVDERIARCRCRNTKCQLREYMTREGYSTPRGSTWLPGIAGHPGTERASAEVCPRPGGRRAEKREGGGQGAKAQRKRLRPKRRRRRQVREKKG